MDSEVSRILSSDTSKTLLSQLKSLTATEATIEEEMMLKTAQIHQLQTYLKTEIQNIHSIAETNSRLKTENEGLRKELGLSREENVRLEELLRETEHNNKQHIENIRKLEQANF